MCVCVCVCVCVSVCLYDLTDQSVQSATWSMRGGSGLLSNDTRYPLPVPTAWRKTLDFIYCKRTITYVHYKQTRWGLKLLKRPFTTQSKQGEQCPVLMGTCGRSRLKVCTNVLTSVWFEPSLCSVLHEVMLNISVTSRGRTWKNKYTHTHTHNHSIMLKLIFRR